MRRCDCFCSTKQRFSASNNACDACPLHLDRRYYRTKPKITDKEGLFLQLGVPTFGNVTNYHKVAHDVIRPSTHDAEDIDVRVAGDPYASELRVDGYRRKQPHRLGGSGDTRYPVRAQNRSQQYPTGHAVFFVTQQLILAMDVVLLPFLYLLLFSTFRFYTKGNFIIIIVYSVVMLMRLASSFMFLMGYTSYRQVLKYQSCYAATSSSSTRTTRPAEAKTAPNP